MNAARMVSTARIAVALALAAAAWPAQGGPSEKAEGPRAKREMQVFKVAELGLKVWVENQPPWEAQLLTDKGPPIFAAASPVGYHPATVMMVSSWPKERVRDDLMEEMAVGAIRRASQNFGLTESHSRAVFPAAARYGQLQGYEATFAGVADALPVDVKMFVGQASGRFPVVLTVYTQSGKMPQLSEQIRRSWNNLTYLQQ